MIVFKQMLVLKIQTIKKIFPKKHIVSKLVRFTIVLLVFVLGICSYCCTTKKATSDEFQDLLSILGTQRPIEARLSEKFIYEPYKEGNSTNNESEILLSLSQKPNNIDNKQSSVPNPRSLENDEQNQDSQKFSLPISKLSLATYKDPSPEKLNRLGIGYLICGRVEEAIRELEKVCSQKPVKAEYLNNLAVAYFTKGKETHTLLNIAKALSIVELAISTDNNLLEAHFNHALILENLFLYSTAYEAWQKYEQLEKFSEWISEAKSHITKLNTIKAKEKNIDQLEKIKQALISNDQQAITEIARQFPYQTRIYVIDELLPNCAEEAFKGGKNSSNLLDSVRKVGNVFVTLQDDNFIQDAVMSIDKTIKSNPKDLAKMVSGYSFYKEGKSFLDKYQLDKAIISFKKANEYFSSANNIAYETLTNLSIGRSYGLQLDYTKSTNLLNKVKSISKVNKYNYLIGRAVWIIGFSDLSQTNLSDALSELKQSVTYLEKAGDYAGLTTVHTNIALTSKQLGNLEDFWQHVFQSLSYSKLTSYSFYGVLLTELANDFAEQGEYKASLYFNEEILKTGSTSDIDGCYTFLLRSQLENVLGKYSEARISLENSKKLLEKISDVSARKYLKGGIDKHLEGDIITTEANIELKSSPQKAIELFNKVIDFYKDTPFRYRIAQTYFSCAKAYSLTGDELKAESYLKASIDEFESQRGRITEESNRLTFFVEPQTAYDEMISIQTNKHNIELAFNYAETARSRALLDSLNGRGQVIKVEGRNQILLEGTGKPFSLNEIKGQLPNNIVLIEYSVLPNKILIWVVKKDGVELAESTIKANDLETKVNNFLTGIQDFSNQKKEFAELSKPLYNALISPIEPLINKINSNLDELSIVLIPDKSLQQLPFAALINPKNNQYLVQEKNISMAPSATVFIKCLQRSNKLAKQDNRKLLAIGDPKFDMKEFPSLSYLEGAEEEAQRIAKMYSNKKLLTESDATKDAFLSLFGQYSIVHFAGHALMDNKSPLYSKLIMAADKNNSDKDKNTSSALNAYELYGKNFSHTKLVVLAACKTATGKNIRGEGLASLARPFLAAGVPTVIASLWNANDQSSKKLFLAFHERLIAGDSPSIALRAAQLRLINNDISYLAHPKMWACFVSLGSSK